MHKTEGEAELSVKAGCLEGLDLRGERGRKAVHIWTKEAVVDIPEGVERYEEEPPGGSLQGQEGGESWLEGWLGRKRSWQGVPSIGYKWTGRRWFSDLIPDKSVLTIDR
jgi:hypothetical protein